MSKWYDVSNEDKRIAYEQVAHQVNVSAFAVEKDWWVVQTLSVLFEMEVGQHMVFKGGTSLSKAWGLIERFSEDIDLAVDRRFYGFEGELRKKQRTNLRKTANTYITETIYPELGSRFKERGIEVELELEKIFLLHEEFQRPEEKIRVDRMSRHLFDIYKLVTSPFAERVLVNQQLYAEIVHHRQLFTKLGGVDYKLHNPGTVNPIPPVHLMDAWKKDYSIMQEQMIYGNSPDFEEMLETIQVFIKRMNSLDWQVMP